MTDVDHFKKFNDTYGHDVGDQVLRMVAARLKKVTGGGKAYRYGGEEFTIVFAGKTMEECQPHLEAVREAIENYAMQLRDKDSRPKNDEQGRSKRSGAAGRASRSPSASASPNAMPSSAPRGSHQGGRPGALQRQERRAQPRVPPWAEPPWRGAGAQGRRLAQRVMALHSAPAASLSGARARSRVG